MCARTSPGKYRIKFKVEALPLKDQLGGYRLLYSHNCQFGLSQVHQADLSMATIVKITLVNEAIVEEVLLPLGQLDFGKGVVGKGDIGLWRTRGEHKQLVGEFAFQVQFPRREDIAEKHRKLEAQLHQPAAGSKRLAGARRNQDGDGVPPERERTPKS